jgi:hypothetical protein
MHWYSNEHYRGGGVTNHYSPVKVFILPGSPTLKTTTYIIQYKNMLHGLYSYL